MKTILSFILICFTILPSFSQSTVKELKITTLSTMVSNWGVGEWGYAALVEVDGHKILFDTGNRPGTVIQNAKDQKIDLSDVSDVILSHFHYDHTGGALSLIRNGLGSDTRFHAGKGILIPRQGFLTNTMDSIKTVLEKNGNEFIIHDQPAEIVPGVWVTGPVDRVTTEKNYPANVELITEEGIMEDDVPEDQSLVINTSKGLVIISGCGHSGIINTIRYTRSRIADRNVHAMIGGFHLVMASDEELSWTADELKRNQVEYLNGAHCTGLNALFELREKMGLDRNTAVIGTVGDQFDLEKGITPGLIAR